MKKFLLLAILSMTINLPTYASDDVLVNFPGRIVQVHVQPNQWVTRGTPLVTMEAMKMHNEIRAARDGYIHDLAV